MNFWVRVRVRVSQHFFRWFAMFFSIFMRALHGITFIRHIFTYIIFYLYLWVLCPWVCLCSSQSPRDSISENKAHIVPTLNGISFCSFSLRIRFRFYSILCVMEYQICIKISIEFFFGASFLSFYLSEGISLTFSVSVSRRRRRNAAHFAILLWNAYVLYAFAVDVVAISMSISSKRLAYSVYEHTHRNTHTA